MSSIEPGEERIEFACSVKPWQMKRIPIFRNVRRRGPTSASTRFPVTGKEWKAHKLAHKGAERKQEFDDSAEAVY